MPSQDDRRIKALEDEIAKVKAEMLELNPKVDPQTLREIHHSVTVEYIKKACYLDGLVMAMRTLRPSWTERKGT